MKRDWTVVAFLVAIQATLFLAFYYREIGWYPPPVFDQAVYLERSYALQESAARSGLKELLRPFITGGHNNSVAFPVEGALFGLFLDVPRLSRLCVGFVAFAALQFCIYSAARDVWKRRAYGFAALGLVLCQSTGWLWAGGLFDYRMDFLAYCLYGIWACLVLRSGLFSDRKSAVGSALIGILLVLNRFLTIVYLSGVLFGFAAVLTVLWVCRDKADARELNLKTRFTNLAISLVVLFCGTIPFLVLNAKGIYRYYFVPHLISGEQYVRSREFGVTSLAGNLLFYPKSVALDHLGPMFMAGLAITVIAGLILFLGGKSWNVGSTVTGSRETQILQVIYLLAAIAGPLVVLTCDISKSPIVGGIVGVPCALLVMWVMVALRSRAAEATLRIHRRVLAIWAVALLSLGALNQFAHATLHLQERYDPESYERLTDVHRWFVESARATGLSSPIISSDTVSQWFNAVAITASGFEQTGKLVPFRQLLGGNIAGVERAEALSELEQSDYIVLTTTPKVGIYPFYEKIRKYWDDLKSWSDDNMLIIRTMPFEGYMVTVYARPLPHIFGLAGDWVTRAGLDLEAEKSTLERFPVITLKGTTEFWLLSKGPSVSVTAQTNNSSMPVPVTLRRDGNNYTIIIDTSALESPRTAQVRFHINFDTFFVPKRLGINDDTRELVIRAPSRVEMRPKQR
jgi:hypothetical protein